MITLNKQFLAECGIPALSDGESSALLRAVYDELELRVGGRLSARLSEASLAEFDRITDGDGVTIAQWIEKHAPKFSEDTLFQEAVASGRYGAEPNPALLGEFAARKWLTVNCPDYENVVEQVVAEMRVELRMKLGVEPEDAAK